MNITNLTAACVASLGLMVPSDIKTKEQEVQDHSTFDFGNHNDDEKAALDLVRYLRERLGEDSSYQFKNDGVILEHGSIRFLLEPRLEVEMLDRMVVTVLIRIKEEHKNREFATQVVKANAAFNYSSLSLDGDNDLRMQTSVFFDNELDMDLLLKICTFEEFVINSLAGLSHIRPDLMDIVEDE